MQEVKSGDIVRIKNKKNKNYGKIYTFLAMLARKGQNSACFLENHENGEADMAWDWELEMAEKKNGTVGNMKFQIGDKVKVIKKGLKYFNKIARIVKVENTGGVCVVEFEDGKRYHIFSSHLEMAENKFSTWLDEMINKDKEKKSAKFNFGEKVKVTKKDSGYYGKQGIVVSGIEAIGFHTVVFDNGTSIAYRTFELEKVEPVEKQQNSGRFVIEYDKEKIAVTNTETSKVTIATCSPKDNFDLFHGICIALLRNIGDVDAKTKK